jgi:hypothetical protein
VIRAYEGKAASKGTTQKRGNAKTGSKSIK